MEAITCDACGHYTSGAISWGSTILCSACLLDWEANQHDQSAWDDYDLDQFYKHSMDSDN